MADTHEPGSRPPRAAEIRTGLREKYSDVYTPEALHAIEALAAFDDDRKQPLPYMPRVIGVITSPTGAVIRDILHRISDRFPVHFVVWPVRVQG